MENDLHSSPSPKCVCIASIYVNLWLIDDFDIGYKDYTNMVVCTETENKEETGEPKDVFFF